MKIQEAFKDIKKCINFVSSPKTSFKEENTQKGKVKGKNVLGEGDVRPGHQHVPPGVQNSA